MTNFYFVGPIGNHLYEVPMWSIHRYLQMHAGYFSYRAHCAKTSAIIHSTPDIIISLSALLTLLGDIFFPQHSSHVTQQKSAEKTKPPETWQRSSDSKKNSLSLMYFKWWGDILCLMYRTNHFGLLFCTATLFCTGMCFSHNFQIDLINCLCGYTATCLALKELNKTVHRRAWKQCKIFWRCLCGYAATCLAMKELNKTVHGVWRLAWQQCKIVWRCLNLTAWKRKCNCKSCETSLIIMIHPLLYFRVVLMP
jgi:hypothetical protein